VESRQPPPIPVPRHSSVPESPPPVTDRRPRRARSILTAVTALGLLAAATTVAAFAGATRSASYSFFIGADVSAVATDPDTNPVELGLRFSSATGGVLTAVRFLKADGDRGEHPVSVWSAGGTRLATATSVNESRSGWQEVTLPKPVTIRAGGQYVVSYHTSRYRSSQGFFTRTVQVGPLATVGAAGVFGYGSGGFPNQTWAASNYWVDVVFTPQPAAPSPAGTATPGATPAPTPSGNARSTGGPGGLSLPRVPWEGGPGYYAGFPVARAAGWTRPAFFPTAVWFEGVHSQREIDLDKAAGLNTYVELTADSNLPLIRSNGMSAVIDPAHPGLGAETTGWLLSDEVDMWGGPGPGRWTGRYPGEGDICTPAGTGCGYDVQNRLSGKLPVGDGRLRYANYGKGVVFWQSDQDAARFVNGWTSAVSSDIYWYTDPNVCTSASEGPSLGVKAADCRRAANYGLTIDRIRELDGVDGRRQPVYAFVEVGHPFTERTAPTITGDQVAGAVMNSLIHEARGIIYFNHNFGGSCESQHVLRDCGVNTTRPKVTETNARIKALAPVLNSQSYQWTFNPGLDTMLKAYAGSYYVFAMPGRTGGTGARQLTLPPGMAGARAEVLFENRTVPITGGAIHDTFAREYTYHVYKVTP
jgi:hypothetical protein